MPRRGRLGSALPLYILIAMSALPLELEELGDWLWCLRTPVVACYAIRDRGGVVLVDANIAGQHNAILEALADRLGVAANAVPIRQLLLTHAHPDHYGSAREIVSATGAELLGPADEAEVFAGRRQLPPPQLREWERPLYEQVMPRVAAPAPIELDRHLRAGDPLDWEIGAQLIAAPGHTPGQLAVWIPHQRTLIAGDALATHDGRPIVGVFNIDPTQAALTAANLLELAPVRLCVGHGATLTGDVQGMFAAPPSPAPAIRPVGAPTALTRDNAQHDRSE
jgi:glyoxylase-like metal-dependent hydrolase (beta-lactamase superfamily II)